VWRTLSEGASSPIHSPGAGITRRTKMRTRHMLQPALLLAIAGGLSPAQALTQEELVAKLQAAGYEERNKDQGAAQ
jgi:hypothetical protein